MQSGDCRTKIKHDGYRAIVRHHGETVRLYSRRGCPRSPRVRRTSRPKSFAIEERLL
jgi:ATP-dependent DNA ligase